MLNLTSLQELNENLGKNAILNNFLQGVRAPISTHGCIPGICPLPPLWDRNTPNPLTLFVDKLL